MQDFRSSMNYGGFLLTYWKVNKSKFSVLRFLSDLLCGKFPTSSFRLAIKLLIASQFDAPLNYLECFCENSFVRLAGLDIFQTSTGSIQKIT